MLSNRLPNQNWNHSPVGGSGHPKDHDNADLSSCSRRLEQGLDLACISDCQQRHLHSSTLEPTVSPWLGQFLFWTYFSWLSYYICPHITKSDIRYRNYVHKVEILVIISDLEGRIVPSPPSPPRHPSPAWRQEAQLSNEPSLVWGVVIRIMLNGHAPDILSTSAWRVFKLRGPECQTRREGLAEGKHSQPSSHSRTAA